MLRKIILMPLYIAVVVLRLGVNVMLGLSAWVFYLLGGLFLLATVCSYYMQLESAAGLRHMIIGSGVMFIIPQAVLILAGLLEVAAEIINDQMRSV